MLGKRTFRESGNSQSDDALELQLLETPKRKVLTPEIMKASLFKAREVQSPAFARALEFGSCHKASQGFIEPVKPQPALVRSRSFAQNFPVLRFSDIENNDVLF